MTASVEVIFPARLAVGGRTLSTVELREGEHLAASTEHTAGAHFLVLVLQGSLFVQRAELRVGGWAFVSDLSGIEGGEECRLALISWHGSGSGQPALIRPVSASAWYEKYEATLSPLDLKVGGQDFLAPWSGYWVEIPPGGDTAAVHVHHHLINLLAIAGEPGTVAGHLLVENAAGELRAWPLRAGDLAMVETGVVHNLVPEAQGAPLRFFVFNDTPSRYQEEASSDYHNLRRVEVAAIPREFWPDAPPRAFLARRAVP